MLPPLRSRSPPALSSSPRISVLPGGSSSRSRKWGAAHLQFIAHQVLSLAARAIVEHCAAVVWLHDDAVCRALAAISPESSSSQNSKSSPPPVSVTFFFFSVSPFFARISSTVIWSSENICFTLDQPKPPGGYEKRRPYLQMIAHQVPVLAARAGDNHGAVVVPLLGDAVCRALVALLAGEDHGVAGHLRGRAGVARAQLAEQLGVGARDAGGARRC
jgi:hypothetical protein